MTFARFLTRISISLSLLLLVACDAHAQYRAGIQGTVLDAQGAAVGDAKITVTSKETGFVQESSTDAGGVYSVGRLAPGLYTFVVEKPGFKRKVIDNVQVTGEQINAVNVTLDVGQVTESVTVNGDQLPAIDTESGVMGGTITSQQIQSLPSFGRDVFQLVQLAPGAFGDGSRNSGGNTNSQPGNQGPSGSGGGSGVFQTENRPQVSINGGRQDSNNVTLDGIGITSVSWGAAAIITPNEDSVKEVRVVTNEYDAESGRFGSGQIQVTSQSGTNQYHGSAFFKADRPGLNAYQPFYGAENSPRTPQRNENRFNQWGGSIGGPIIKNKLFVFFAYETIRNQGTNISNGWYDTAPLLKLAPSGSQAARYGAFPGEAVSATGVVNQSCASIGLVQGVNCYMIPGQGLNLGRPLDPALFPLGTPDPSFKNNLNPGLGGDGTGNSYNLDPTTADIAFVNTTGPNNQTNQQYNGRLDFTPTSRDLLAFNIYYVPVSTTTFNNPRPANIFYHNAINEAMTGLWTHTFSPTLINEARINAAGWRWNELADNPQSPLGLPNPAYIGDPNNGNHIGTINANGNTLGGVAGSIFDQWTYGAKDVVSKVQGAHTLKFGAELTKLHFVQEAPWSARPNWGFQNYWDFLNDAPLSETGVFNPTTGVPTDVRKDSRQTFYGFFIQDNYKIKPNLTLTAGLRWDYFGPVTFTRNQLSTVVLGDAPNPLTALYMRIGGNLYNSQAGNFGPQLGFAWSPGAIAHHEMNSRLVIRGGFGIGYTAPEQAITLNGWPNIPFTNNGTFLTGSNVVYDFPSNPHQFEPYPANPNTIAAFNQNNIPIGGSPVSVTAFPASLKTPYTYRYSLEGQYDLGRNWVATLGYQGSTSHHLTRQSNLNLIYGAEGIALNPEINNVDYYSYDANSNFNAFLAELQHRFARSFEIDAQYRLSKSMDNASGPYEINYYQWNPKLDWGPSDFNATNVFKLWGIYTPNFFKEGWQKKVLGGWTISGIFNWHSGFPWSPVYNSTCNLIYASGACTNGGNTQLTPVAYLGGAKSDYSNSAFLRPGGNFPNGGATYFTAPTYTTCTLPFPEVCPGAPQQPGIERNSQRGPGYRDVDATLSKAFGLPKMRFLGENAQFEFRANFYNLFNNLNLDIGQIDRVVTDPTFGEITGALGGRTIELQARFSF
jgi:hypothetical protein